MYATHFKTHTHTRFRGTMDTKERGDKTLLLARYIPIDPVSYIPVHDLHTASEKERKKCIEMATHHTHVHTAKAGKIFIVFHALGRSDLPPPSVALSTVAVAWIIRSYTARHMLISVVTFLRPGFTGQQTGGKAKNRLHRFGFFFLSFLLGVFVHQHSFLYRTGMRLCVFGDPFFFFATPAAVAFLLSAAVRKERGFGTSLAPRSAAMVVNLCCNRMGRVQAPAPKQRAENGSLHQCGLLLLHLLF